ncbi:MAG TPA: protocatechuate 3,4-dioxygenase [Polyangiaceae bacterium]|nr:protocatechuate 3,4-dioxygenase [Polyangiaceae bacterium]
MGEKRTPVRRHAWSRSVPRRDALRGLGALAVSLPALTTLGCSSDDNTEDKKLDDAKGGDDDSDDSSASAQAKADAGAKDGGSTSHDAGTQTSSARDAGAADHEPTATDAGSASSTSQDAAPAEDAGASDAAGASTTPPPMFADAGSCTLTATDIEGPFLIEENERMDDESMIRSDCREGHPGCEFQLSFRFLDANKKCAPIPDLEAYIWHCDADGYYSGFAGQDPTVAYMGSPNPSPDPSKPERFCRGVQMTDKDGIVNFTTIYPGWYTGRPIHVHLMGRTKGATGTAGRVITTQLYFPADLTHRIHTNEPAYQARAADIPAGSLNPPSGGFFGSSVGPTLTGLTYTDGSGLIVGALNVIVKGI